MPASGERVFFGSHSVHAAGNHAGIIMMIDSRSRHWNDKSDDIFNENAPLFGGGIKFATKGVGPRDGKGFGDVVYAEYNRPDSDVKIITGGRGGLRLEHLTGDSGAISSIIEHADNFIKNHNSGVHTYTYDGLPGRGFGRAANNFNSNSFAHGLLIASGVSIPDRTGAWVGGFAGWEYGPELYNLGSFDKKEVPR